MLLQFIDIQVYEVHAWAKYMIWNKTKKKETAKNQPENIHCLMHMDNDIFCYIAHIDSWL